MEPGFRMHKENEFISANEFGLKIDIKRTLL